MKILAKVNDVTFVQSDFYAPAVYAHVNGIVFRVWVITGLLSKYIKWGAVNGAYIAIDLAATEAEYEALEDWPDA